MSDSVGRGLLEPASQSVCGCCSGLTHATPLRVENRPGLSAIAYRVGTHASFKRSLLAGLSDSDPERSPLGKLQTRSDDDFSIALLDAFAVMADVLTFYQERIANEQYLRTATERLSVEELAQLIGYKLAPGVAADAWLAFTLDDAKGAPRAVAIAPGARVQSVPGPGETPQTFETIESLDARADWNALQARRTAPLMPALGRKEIYFAGVATHLKVGDWILLVGDERAKDPTSDQWDLRQVDTIAADLDHDVTHVTWTEGLGFPRPKNESTVFPAAVNVKAYAMRLRASLFGYNAPDPRILTKDVLGQYGITVDASHPAPSVWPDLKLTKIDTDPGAIHLDGAVTSIVPGSWVALSRPGEGTPQQKDHRRPYVELYEVKTAAADSRNMFGLAGKTTRLTLSGENLQKQFDDQVRQAIVFGQSEELTIAEKPIVDAVPAIADEDVEADRVTLDRIVDDPGVGRRVLLRGVRARVVVTGTDRTLGVRDDNGVKQPFQFASGDVLEVMAPPITSAKWDELLASSRSSMAAPGRPFPVSERRYRLRNNVGQEGFVIAKPESFAPADPPKDADTISELATVKQVDVVDRLYTRLIFDAPLTMAYDRASLAIAANVAKATHGEAVAEVLGSGSGNTAFQKFTLKQSPLTYTRSLATDTGAASTLRITVNDLVWSEVDNFFGRGPRERVFITRIDDDAKTTVEFGDGKTGARLPTGSENVKATYRKGIGTAGLVKADQLSLLLARPLGVRSVTNPLPAANAADPETLDRARQNAPPTVLTLGRVVSLLDYRDFARAFLGVAKALATWTFDHHARGVYITVAGTNGADVADGGDLQVALIQKLQQVGNPLVPIRVHGYRRAYFRVQARVKWDAAAGYQQDLVFDAVRASLASAFSFSARDFGQPVTMSEIIGVVQSVAGVVAMDVQQLYRTDTPPGLGPAQVLEAQRPTDGSDADAVLPAELLLLDPTATPELEELP